MKKLVIIFMIIFNCYGFNLFDIKTYKADFKQIVINSQNKKVLYSGTIYIKDPFYILWEYKTPVEKNIYIKKNRVTIIEPELEQAIVTNLQNEINLIKLLQQSKKVSENQYKSIFNDRVYFIKIDNNKISQIKYKDQLDNTIQIKFFNIKQNQLIKNQIFDFVIPFDYDIIKR